MVAPRAIICVYFKLRDNFLHEQGSFIGVPSPYGLHALDKANPVTVVAQN